MIRLVVMGVAGCGKSTLGAALARALGCRFVEGDDYHLPESQRKMRAGIALDDADREPWLAAGVGVFAAEPGEIVVACSALKSAYRDRLRQAASPLHFIYLGITEAESLRRVGQRAGHFYPASLVASQFAALQDPTGETGVLALDAAAPPDVLAHRAAQWLAVVIGRPVSVR